MDEKVIKNLQYRKNLSIAFFNATNAAIELIKTDHAKGKDPKEFIVEWRDWLLEEHKNYYAETIANIGTNYNAEETVKKLESAKTVDELKAVWIGLSEDERQDEKIKAKAQSLKTQLS